MVARLRYLNLRHTTTTLVLALTTSVLLGILLAAQPGGQTLLPLVISFCAVSTLAATAIGIRNDLRRREAILHLAQLVEQLAAGYSGVHVTPTGESDLDELVVALNRMAKETEDRLRRIATEGNQLSAILSSMADGVIMVDSEGIVTLLNRAAAALLQTDAQKAVGRSFVQVARDYELVRLLQACLSGGQQQSAFVERLPVTQQTVALPVRQFLSVVVTPVSSMVAAPRQPGSRGGALVLLSDLSELRRLETIRRDFIANVSHELRTPLASIKLLVETLQTHAQDDPEAANRFLDRIATEVDHMNQMVAELLDLARIEGGRLSMQIQPQPVAELLHATAERLEPLAERQGLRLTIADEEGIAELPPVLADAERIRQVLTNLVHNAIKFTPPGGSVTLSARFHDEHAVVISVQDSGIGIAPEDVPRVFERFYKIDRARARNVGGGTGLGLSIAKHIVQVHNGNIWVTSSEGQGSTFSFTLPFV